MRKENILLWVLPFVMVFVGIFTGMYFGIYRSAIAVEAIKLEKSLIAPSPVITYSQYSETKKQLMLDIKNPGGMPILLLSKTLVMKPADTKKEPVVLMSSIPLNVVIPPYSNISLNLNVDKLENWFSIGDILETTLTYSLPISNDIYAIIHKFKKSSNLKDGLVQNELWDNKDKESAYKKVVKESSKNFSK